MNQKELLALLNHKEEKSTGRHSRVLLIDGLNLFFRNFSVINSINVAGNHIGGLEGFIRSMNSLINQIKPTSVYMVFDGIGSSTNRKNLIPEYKEGRNTTRMTNWDVFESLEEEKDSKIDQIIRLVHYLKCLPVKTLSLDNVEADDVIAYISDIMSNKHNSQVFIVSSDKDYIQLVNDKITVYRPTEKEYYTEHSVKKKYGLLSENFIIYKTLLGDQSDKIAGIKGLGEKGILKKFPELAERPISFDELIEISASKHKEHVVYSRIVFEVERLKNTYKIMDLSNPLMDELEKEFVEDVINEYSPQLNLAGFLRLFHEDGLGHLIKNPEYVIRDTYQALISYNK